MTTHVQTALDFARECLRWERPTDRRYGERNKDAFGKPCRAWTPYIFDSTGKNDQFHYTELDAVMPAVRKWCDENKAGLEMSYYGYVPGGWGVNVSTRVSVEEIVHSDLCQALMAACVQAARKLKTA